MSLVFHTIRWKNFLSTGNDWTEVSLDSNSTTLIVGENGAGKSTILDALCYLLYNKPFRKINKPQLINSINGKNCMVEGDFTSGRDEYTIRRGMRPNVFEIEKNGELISQDAANRDYQEILEKYILKMNMKSFCQVVILGSASFVPFMQLPTGQRREIIEDFLDIQIFTTMNMLLKDKVSKNQSDILEVDYKIELTNEKIKMNEEHLRNMIDNSKELIDELVMKAERLQRDADNERNVIEEKTLALRALESSLVEPKDLFLKQSSLTTIKNKLEARVERLNHDIEFFGQHDNCPTCKQEIDQAFRNSTIEEKRKSLDEVRDAVTQADTKLGDVQRSIDLYNDTVHKVNEAKLELRLRRDKVKGIDNSITDTNSQIEKIKARNVSFVSDNTKTRELEGEIERLTNEKSKLHELREVHRVVSTILKDTGIKAKIIKQYIPIINKLINKYLASMDFFVQFELDENFNESIKSRFRDEFSYASFSEGEKAKIDLALLFAWRAVAKLRNSAATNLIILDEVFDGSLDANSSDELLKILIEISNNSNIFTISHKTDALLDKFDRVIRFEKRQNYSVVAE